MILDVLDMLLTASRFATSRRHDLTKRLKKLSCRTLVFVGDHSPFYEEALHMTSKIDKRYCALVEVPISPFLYKLLCRIWHCIFLRIISSTILLHFLAIQ